MNEPICFEESMTLDERVSLQVTLQRSIPALRRKRWQQLAILPLLAWFVDERVRNVFHNPARGLPAVGIVVALVGVVWYLQSLMESKFYRLKFTRSHPGTWPKRARWSVSEDELKMEADDGSYRILRHRQLQSVRAVGEYWLFRWNGQIMAQVHRSKIPADALRRMRTGAPQGIAWQEDAASF
jgi:hypothetical protein